MTPGLIHDGGAIRTIGRAATTTAEGTGCCCGGDPEPGLCCYCDMCPSVYTFTFIREWDQIWTCGDVGCSLDRRITTILSITMTRVEELSLGCDDEFGQPQLPCAPCWWTPLGTRTVVDDPLGDNPCSPPSFLESPITVSETFGLRYGIICGSCRPSDGVGDPSRWRIRLASGSAQFPNQIYDATGPPNTTAGCPGNFVFDRAFPPPGPPDAPTCFVIENYTESTTLV